MVKKKRKVTKKTNSKKVLKSSKGYVKKISAVQKKNIKNKTYELPLNAFLKSVVKFIQVLSLSTSKIIIYLNKYSSNCSKWVSNFESERAPF